MSKLLSFVLFLPFIFINELLEKQYSFLHVNNEDGLVNNHVTKIYKDSRGFVWIGTTGGLSRYDGTSFVNYQHNSLDSLSIIDNYIVNIQEDSNNNLWIETSHINNLIVYDVTQEKFYSDLPKYLGKDIEVDEVYTDSDKQLWIKQNSHKYFQKFSLDKNELQDVFPKASSDQISLINFFQANNDYYYFFDDGTIECYDGNSFELRFRNNYLQNKLGSDKLNTLIFVDSDKDIWFYGNNNGVYHFEFESEKWNHYSINQGSIKLTSNIVRKIIQDEKGMIWVATDHGGINIINKFSKEVIKIYHQSDNEKSIAQNSITDLYLDDNNIVWLGTYKNGVSYYHESIHKFSHYNSLLSDNKSLPYNDVNCFVEDALGNLWIGTNGGGLIYFNRHDNTFTSYRFNKDDRYSLSNDVVVSLFIDNEGVLWVGTFTGGLNRFDGKRFKRYLKDGSTTSSKGLTNNSIWSINEDYQQNLWIGTLGGGILLFDRKTETFKAPTNKGKLNLPTNFISQIYRLSDGNMFIATSTGVFFYNHKEQRFKYHPTNNRTSSLLKMDRNINEVFEDSRGLYWIATLEGLIVLDPKSNYSKYFNKNDGLAEDIISCIKEDEFQSIWVSKSTGLSQIIINKLETNDDYSFHVYDFTEEDGLQGKEFNQKASLKTSNNELIFGGPNGFNLFKSKDIKYNKILPKVVFTGLQVYNNHLSPGEKIKNFDVLKQSIVSTKKITLKHAMNVFSIDFTALDFFIPNKIKYKYILEGFDQDWQQLDNKQNRVSYTNLNSGDYYFKVKASNNDGLWNNKFSELHIEILPPFYATPLAYIIYVFVLILSLGYFRYVMLQKERKKFAIEQDKLIAKRNHEMDEMKFHFFTNISHEFRTPLTLILTPIDRLLKKSSAIEDKKLFEIIDRNAKQLLNLINQLLDFRKLELHGLKYNPSYGDIVTFLEAIIDNFEADFAKKKIEFSFSHILDGFMLNFDKERLEKVMMNLLSNALKFTPEHGKVSVGLEIDKNEENISIFVEDTGMGINKNDIDNVFIRFYQSEGNKKLGLSGSGIGLNLSKEMIQLHQGDISVESEEGKGAKFIVSFPIDKSNRDRSDTVINEKKTVAKNESFIRNGNKPKPVVLLVEDNIDFRSFMKSTLEDKFKIHEAGDGKIGFEMVHEIIPDLIISDVMMPNMNGLDLCKKLRSDIRTSHIPLILLTARTADEDKIKGFEIGADDYITKPFNMDLLMLRVNKLLKKRSEMHQEFQKNIDISPSDIEITSLDEKLIEKAINLVEKNISESSFSVEDLSSELGMSRVYLYKKLMSITGKSPIEFIRIIRLKRGAQLLRKSQKNIAEVAYEVGFNNPRYFSKYFKKEFGILPTTFVKQNSPKR